MAQMVIASKDVELYITFDAIGVARKITTGANFTPTVSGNTEDIHAISSAEPIATENGSTTYDLSLTLQSAEATRIMDELAAAMVAQGLTPFAHIRQVVEAARISVVTKKLRDVPATFTTKTYLLCTGVEESENIERNTAETLVSWRWRAKGMTRETSVLPPFNP